MYIQKSSQHVFNKHRLARDSNLTSPPARLSGLPNVWRGQCATCTGVHILHDIPRMRVWVQSETCREEGNGTKSAVCLPHLQIISLHSTGTQSWFSVGLDIQTLVESEEKDIKTLLQQLFSTLDQTGLVCRPTSSYNDGCTCYRRQGTKSTCQFVCVEVRWRGVHTCCFGTIVDGTVSQTQQTENI